MEWSVPVQCLSGSSLAVLSALDASRVLPAAGGEPRDWRGVAQRAGLSAAACASLRAAPEPTRRALHAWSRAQPRHATLAALAELLRRIDRWDVLDDCRTHFEADAARYLNSINENAPEEGEREIDSNASQSLTRDSEAITFSDVQSLSLQNYDAYVLFADEDYDFANELIERMKVFGFKLCVRDDLLCGLNFEHSAVMRLISERCARLIVILTPEFIKSPINTYIIDYTQALGIERKQRKILPIIFKPCVIPPQLSYYFPLNYHRIEKSQFWNKLKDSLEVKSPVSTSKQRIQDTPALKQKTKVPSKSVSKLQSNDILTNSNNQLESEISTSSLSKIDTISDSDFCNSIQDIPVKVEPKPVHKNKVRKKIQKFLNRFAN